LAALPALPAKPATQAAVVCGDCGLRDVCLVEGLTHAELDRLTGMVATRRRVRRGESLYRSGDRFEAVYPIRLGFFKSRVTADDGREQVTGFPMPGDILGFDAISSGNFQCDAIALEDAEVCVVPFEKLESLSREFTALQHQLHRVLSREIVRDQGVMMLLGTMRAEQRIATFVLNLSQRLQQRGFSPTEFILRMTREEIGNFLGLKLETVSRAFSKLQDDGVISIEQKRLRIQSSPRLRDLAGASCGLE
jgi:CRP/FNR family transcriptional regulator, anaerobic regulatory protein